MIWLTTERVVSVSGSNEKITRCEQEKINKQRVNVHMYRFRIVGQNQSRSTESRVRNPNLSNHPIFRSTKLWFPMKLWPRKTSTMIISRFWSFDGAYFWSFVAVNHYYQTKHTFFTKYDFWTIWNVEWSPLSAITAAPSSTEVPSLKKEEWKRWNPWLITRKRHPKFIV